MRNEEKIRWRGQEEESWIRQASELALGEDWGRLRALWDEADSARRGERLALALGRLPALRIRMAMPAAKAAPALRGPLPALAAEPPEMAGCGWIEAIGAALGELSEGEMKSALAQALRIGGAEAAAGLAESAAKGSAGAEELLGRAEWGLGPFGRLGLAAREKAISDLAERAGRAPERGWAQRMALDAPDAEGAGAIEDLARGRWGKSPAGESPREALKGALELINAGKAESLRAWLAWMARRGIPLSRQIPQRGRPNEDFAWVVMWPRGARRGKGDHRFGIRPRSLVGAALFAGEDACLEELLAAGAPLPSPKAFFGELAALRGKKPERSFHMLPKSGVTQADIDDLLKEYDDRIARARARWEGLRLSRGVAGAAPAARGARAGI